MWLKIKVWTKVILFGLLALYALFFLINNGTQEVSFWYWFGREPRLPAIVVVAAAFATGVIGTILVRTTFKTLRQIRELQARSRSEKLQRDIDEMKTKAAALRTRENVTETEPPPGEPGL
jgi:uncharacterized integral membrane protein